MERETIVRFKDLCEEISYLSIPISDTVRGSDAEFPWSERTYSVQGRTSAEMDRLAVLRAKKQEAEEWAANLPWHKQKLARAVMRYGARWDVVRWAIGSDKSSDAVRVEFDRLF